MTTMNPSKKRRAFLMGVGSILDLRGVATYRRMQALMPPPTPRRTFQQASRATGQQFQQTLASAHNSFSNSLNQNFPDPDTSAALRDRAPEVYEAWLRTTEDTIETDNYVRRAEVDNPRKMATRGLAVGAVVVLALFALAAYAIWLRQQWLAGFLVTIDVAVLASIFTGNTPPPRKGGEDS